jgi:ribosome biogenesis GTPase A
MHAAEAVLFTPWLANSPPLSALMAVGSSGLGKSTLLNTLCDQMLFPTKQYPSAGTPVQERKLDIQTTYTELKLEGGTIVNVTIVDCPGFAESINNEAQLVSWPSMSLFCVDFPDPSGVTSKASP